LTVVVAVVVSAVMATVGLVARPAQAAGTGGSRPCGDAVRKHSGTLHDRPVMFVHGFGGGPWNFRAERDGRPSIRDAVGSIRGVATYTFDYSSNSLGWVTDPAIGPALAAAITCVAGLHHQRVVIVAHSMGGLATQFAQGQVIDGRQVATHIRRLITIGTPFEGAQLLSFASGAGGAVFNTISDAVLGACDRQARTRRTRDFCGLLGTTETPAVQAMIPGSPQLGALPAWQPEFGRFPIAGDIDVTISVFGLEQDFGMGDLAVSVDAAVAGASRHVAPFVVGCHSSLLDLVTAIDDSPCSHTNELANRRVERRVSELVRSVVRKPAGG
jgi:pimeloyl-ACP methyl ester carboxylesterase